MRWLLAGILGLGLWAAPASAAWPPVRTPSWGDGDYAAGVADLADWEKHGRLLTNGATAGIGLAIVIGLVKLVLDLKSLPKSDGPKQPWE